MSSVCLDCPVIVTDGKSRCLTHRRAKDRARGTRQERGYGADHKALRAEWQRRMDAGERVTCWRCAEQGHTHDVDPNRWDLGHDDNDRSVYRGPECYGNRATSGRVISPNA